MFHMNRQLSEYPHFTHIPLLYVYQVNHGEWIGTGCLVEKKTHCNLGAHSDLVIRDELSDNLRSIPPCPARSSYPRINYNSLLWKMAMFNRTYIWIVVIFHGFVSYQSVLPSRKPSLPWTTKEPLTQHKGTRKSGPSSRRVIEVNPQALSDRHRPQMPNGCCSKQMSKISAPTNDRKIPTWHIDIVGLDILQCFK